jgi:SAM-dependent methyltransferase
MSYLNTAWEYTKLFALYLWVKITNLPESLAVFFKYYLDYPYAKIDLSLLSLYLKKGPFEISKEYLQSRGAHDIYQYGETPLTTMDFIAKTCGINKNDTVFELGCGRARTCFWLNHFIGCNVVGVDFIPFFIESANAIKNKFNLNNIQFIESNFLKTDLKGATVVYLYGTCLEDDQIKKLILNLEKLPIGTKVISVSFPLSDYTDKPSFEVMKRFPASFPWGSGDVYLQIRK